MSTNDFEEGISMCLCVVLAPTRFPYNIIHFFQLASMSTDHKALDDLIGDKHFGSIGSDDSCAELLERRFASPSNESSCQVVVSLQHVERFDVGLRG